MELKSFFIIIAISLYGKIGAYAIQVNRYEKKLTALGNSSQYLVQGTLFMTDDDNYPYATCKTTKPNFEIICNVTLISSAHDYRTCTDVKIYSSDGKMLFLGGYFQVLPYTRNHVLLAWWDNSKSGQDKSTKKEQSYKLGIVNMIKCTTAYLDFPIDKVAYSFFPAAVLYANHIEVVINSKDKCAGLNRCALSYDLEGKQLGGVQLYQPEISQYANPVSVNSSEKGYFMSVLNLQHLNIFFINSTGEGKLLLQDEIDPQIPRHLTSFSSRHELYTNCHVNLLIKNLSSIRCYQFDGQTKLRINKTLTTSLGVRWLAVRSIANGGILLATTGCEKEKWDMGVCPYFHVFYINADGRTSSPFNVDARDLQCYDAGIDLQVHIIEGFNTDEYCFNFSCLRTNSSLTYISKCTSLISLPR